MCLLPLSGIKVIDLTRLLPGPFATQVMVDYGAEVIKVEDLETGDYLRALPPVVNERGAMYYPINRGKKNIRLDLKTEAGREVFRRLVVSADVLVEGFRPGVMDRLGLGYEALKQINPRLIYCALTGYGYSGPYRDKAGHDINYLSYAGIAGLIGEPDRAPVIPGIQIADIGGGAMWAVIAVLLALRARDLTGVGQFCDVSMLDGIFAWTVFALGATSLTGVSPQRGSELLSGGYACYNIYRTADGKYISLGAVEYKFWRQFCILIGHEEYIPLHLQVAAQEQLKREVAAIIATRTQNEWMELAYGYDFCFTPVLDYAEALDNEQLQARGMVVPGNYDGFDTVAPGPAIKLSLTPGRVASEVAAPGEHTVEVLKNLGYDNEEIEGLLVKRVIA